MRLTTCPKCQGRSLWHLRAVYEEAGGMAPAELAPSLHSPPRGWKEWAESSFGTSVVYGPKPTPTANGRFELLICRGCGHCRWFVSGARVEADWIPLDTRCVDCAYPRCFRIEHVDERTGDGVAPMGVLSRGRRRGHFSATVCADCGYAMWVARDLGPPRCGLLHALLQPARTFSCQGCGSSQAWHIDEYRETGDQGTTPLHVLMWRERAHTHSLGKFAVDVCADCGRAEWFAREIDELNESPARGVSAVALSIGTSDGGPYR